ncbi:MAG: PEP-CTERM sorting domain-containing protein [Cyanobacteria bacterium P01_G01_bin.49]
MKKLASSLSIVPLLLVGVGSAQAADLNPPVPGNFTNVYGFSSPGGATNGVNVTIAGGVANFDFIPSVLGADGEYDVDTATGAFAEFANVSGIIQDFTLPFPIAPGAPVATPIATFLNLDGVAAPDSVFDLTTTFGPTFTETASGTTVTFDFAGVFRQLGADPLDLDGVGSISATFAGETQASILAAAQTDSGITTPNSGTFIVEFVEPPNVPEPTTLVGLAAVAGSLALTRRKKKQ